MKIKEQQKTGIMCLLFAILLMSTIVTAKAQEMQMERMSDVTEVLLPTKLNAAFNPYGYGIRMGDTVVYDQVISGNYGVLNLSPKDKIVWVDISVVDQNGVITFVQNRETVEQAGSSQYVVCLELVTGKPAETFTENSTGKDLLGVTLTEEDKQVVSITQEGVRIGFKLKGTMERIDNVMAMTVELPMLTVSGGDATVSGGDATVSGGDATVSGGDATVSGGDATVSGGDATVSGGDATAVYCKAGVTADNSRGFTVKGTMNSNADWSKLASPITIKVDYCIEEVEGDMETLPYGFVK